MELIEFIKRLYHSMWTILFVRGQIKNTHSLYSQKYKENIPCHKQSELYFMPRVVLKQFNSEMKLGFASGAV